MDQWRNNQFHNQFHCFKNDGVTENYWNWRGEKLTSSKKKKATKSKIKMYWSRFDIVYSRLELNGVLPKLGITFFRMRRIYMEFCEQAGKSITYHNVKKNNKLSASNWYVYYYVLFRDGLLGKLVVE